jgi:hypothetical protein
VWWQEPDGSYDRMVVTDLTEAVERIVAAHEDLVATRQINRAPMPSEPESDLGPEVDATDYTDTDLYRGW